MNKKQNMPDSQKIPATNNSTDHSTSNDNNNKTWSPHQSFPTSPLETTALKINNNTLSVCSTYPPTLNLYDTENYNTIYERRIDYEARKIINKNSKIMMLQDSYVEFHSSARYVERVKVNAIDMCYNDIDGRLYLINSNKVSVMDFSRNVLLTDSDTKNNRNNKEYERIKINKHNGLAYILNNNLEGPMIEVHDIRNNNLVPVMNIPCKNNKKIDSFDFLDGNSLFYLSENTIYDCDIRKSGDSVSYNINTGSNKYNTRVLKCFEGVGLFVIDNTNSISNSSNKNIEDILHISINKVDHEIKINSIKIGAEITDYTVKGNMLYVGTDEGVKMFKKGG